MFYQDRSKICCFSGYRPEKMPFTDADYPQIPSLLYPALLDTIQIAYQEGYQIFLSGMSRGFDLWAAQTVLILAHRLPISLLAVLPYPDHYRVWNAAWQQTHQTVLAQATSIYTVCPNYTVDCYDLRNQFMVNASSRLICYFDGQTGGTKNTLQHARHAHLPIYNLADMQLSFPLP